jgi:hypothetical protein
VRSDTTMEIYVLAFYKLFVSSTMLFWRKISFDIMLLLLWMPIGVKWNEHYIWSFHITRETHGRQLKPWWIVVEICSMNIVDQRCHYRTQHNTAPLASMLPSRWWTDVAVTVKAFDPAATLRPTVCESMRQELGQKREKCSGWEKVSRTNERGPQK